MNGDFTGDFSDLTAQQQQPVQPQPPQPQPPQPQKPLEPWEVLDHYHQASAQSPDLAKLSVPEFSQKMNEVTGTNMYDAGLKGDWNWVRAIGLAPEVALHRFGATYPGAPVGPSGAIVKALGGPQEGIDIPGAIQHGVESLGQRFGVPSGVTEPVAAGASALPEMGLIAASGIESKLGLAAAGGVLGYGRHGAVLPAGVSAATFGFMPNIAEGVSQSFLKNVGAKTLKDLSPELGSLLDTSTQGVQDYLARYTPTTLAQHTTEALGRQFGTVGTMQVGGAAEALTDPNLSWQERLQQAGTEFSPSSLVSAAVSSLPFAGLDVYRARTDPVARAVRGAQADFTRRFVAQAVKGDPETGSPGFLPTQAHIDEAMRGAVSGKVPDTPAGKVLKSMGQVPLVPELDRPVVTKDEAVPMPEMMNGTRARAQELLFAQGANKIIGDSYDQTLSETIRSLEIGQGNNPLSKEVMTDMAANIVADRYWSDLNRREATGTEQPIPTEKNTPEQNSLLRQKQRMGEINNAISRTIPDPDDPTKQVANPAYDQGAHQRVALVSGSDQERVDAGITAPPTYMAGGETTPFERTVDQWKGTVRRTSKVPVPLTRNLIDFFTGRQTRVTGEEIQAELNDRTTEWEDVKDQAAALREENTGQWTEATYKQYEELRGRAQYLKGEVARIRGELTASRAPQRVAKAGSTVGVALNEARATQEAVIAAYDYGKTHDWNVNDPERVTDFIKFVSTAAKRGALNATRLRGQQRTFEELPTIEDARQRLDQLNRAAKTQVTGHGEFRHVYTLDEENGEPTVYTDKDGKPVYRITEHDYISMAPIFDNTEEGTTEEAMGAAVAERTGITPKPVTLADMGHNIEDLSANRITGRMEELDKLTDKAESAARKRALANNVGYYFDAMPDAEFKQILLHNFAGPLLGREEGDIRGVQKLKDRMIRYAQFLRDGGKIQTYEENGRIYGGPPEALQALQRYMGGSVDQGGLGMGVYKDTDKIATRRGTPRIEDWNDPRQNKVGLNFFEQFAVLMDTMRKRMIDPTAYEGYPEYIPKGDLQSIPPMYRQEAANNLLVKWGPEFEPKTSWVYDDAATKKAGELRLKEVPVKQSGGMFGLSPEALAAYPVKKDFRLDVRDRDGNPVSFAWGKRNPLITFFTESAKRDLTMPLNQMVDLFRQFGNLNPENTRMLALAQKLTNLSPFLRDMPVGANIARDPEDKAYYHTDEVMSSAGILLSPFEAPSLTEAGGRYVRNVMNPNDFFPHFMNEIGHGAVDFAYRQDKAFQTEIDRIHAYVKDFVDAKMGITAKDGDFSQYQIHALSRPEEFLAGMFNDVRLHQLLKEIPDPYDPLPNRSSTGYVGTLFDRIVTTIKNMLSRLFNVDHQESGTLFDRMTQLASRGVEIQMELNAQNAIKLAGDIYQKADVHNLVLPEGPTNVLATPVREYRETKVGGEGGVYLPHTANVDQVNVRLLQENLSNAIQTDAEHSSKQTKNMVDIARRMLDKAQKRLLAHEAGAAPPEPPPYTWTINHHEFRLEQALHHLNMAEQYPLEIAPAFMNELKADVAQEETILNALYAKQQSERGTMLSSRLVPDENDLTDIEKPVLNLGGRKGTLLRDPIVNHIVSSFTAGRNVKDAFSGSGQLSTFAKNAGANRVSLNVFRPEMHSIFDEIKNNPNGFGRRVANVARLIDSRRNEVPRMRDGSDLPSYLDGVQARDPNVGLYMKQNLNYFGREVGQEGAFTPAASITNQGLSELPSRIRNFSRSVDEVTRGNGWDVVGKAGRGDRVMVDPPYVGRGRYGEAVTSPEQRVAEYEKYMYPAALRGAKFLVFDAADPALMESLASHGFTVQPVQRSTRAGAVPRQEFVAYNHTQGEMLTSRVDPQRVLDSMKGAALYIQQDPTDKIWFRPYSETYFRDTYAPLLGTNLTFEQRGREIGFSVPRAALNNLTLDDVARMPRPRVKYWAPSLFETMQSMYRDDGSDPATAKALALSSLQTAAMFKNSEWTMWGKIPNEPTAVAKAFFPYGAVGLSPETIRQRQMPEQTIRHELTHTVGGVQKREGWDQFITPDVAAVNEVVSDNFSRMSPEQRKVMLEGLGMLTTWDMTNPGHRPSAVILPSEFGAEFVGNVGEALARVPEPSVYLKEQMRFVSDDLSKLLTTYTLRRQQALIHMADGVEQLSKQRGISNPGWSRIITELSDAFKSLARPALDISYDQAETYRLKGLYPDQYQALMSAMANQLQRISETYATIGEVGPKLPQGDPPGTILASRESVENMFRRFMKLPTSEGKLPDKLGWWDRFLTNNAQFALKYPIARSAWQMFYAGRAQYTAYRDKMSAALAGALTGNSVIDDAKTKQISEFRGNTTLRKQFDGITQEMNMLGDHMFKAELADKGDIMTMNPDIVTGWATPAFRNGLLQKYGVPDKDIPTINTVLDGTREQIKMSNEQIVRTQAHKLDALVGVIVSKVTDLPPEAARETAKLLTDAVKTQNTDPDTAMAKLTQFQQTLNNQQAFSRAFDAVTAGWENIQRLERFLELRMGYFMSERRPGQFGLFYKDANDKVTSRYYRSEKERNDAATRMGITTDTPYARFTNPTDRNFGVAPEVFKQLEDVQQRTEEKLVNIFGPEQGKELSAAMDMVSDLRDALNARDVLKLTTGRDLAPGREDLDMFNAHQQYINALGKAAYNTFVRAETEILNANSVFDTQPQIKDYINRQVKMVLQPDSVIGRWAQNLGFMYYLWANPSSMIMQAMHQLLGLAPMLTSRGASIAGSFNIIRQANLMFMESRRNGGVYKDPDIQAIIDQTRRDGNIGSWTARELDYGQDLSLTNRLRATTGEGKNLWVPFDLLKNKMYQGFDLMRRLYDIIPTYNSEVATVASALHLKSAAGGSLTGDQLYNETQFLRANTMFMGGKENRPGFFQYLPRSAAQAVWNLQTYANGITTMMGELIRKSVSPKGAGLTPAQGAQVRKAAAQMLITQTALAGVIGLPFAQAILYGLQKLFPEHNIEEDVRDALASLFGDDQQTGQVFSSAVTMGMPTALLPYGPDLGSRFALAGTFHVSPYSGVGWQQLVGPTGGIMSRALEAIQAGVHGDPVTSVEQLMPNGFQRIWKTLEQGNQYRTESGQLLVNDLTPEEIVARAIGFTPARVARLQDFERLSKLSEDAAKAQQTGWTREQVKLMGSGQDDLVRQNLAKRVAETRGVYDARQLSNDISREYERQTTPADLRAFGNRSTVLAQKSLRGVLGTQSEGPGSLERLQLQQSIANRLGLGGPSRGSLLHANRVDQLQAMYPHLTNAQANLLLTHAYASRPSPDLRQALLQEYQ